jgi:hypothetical protein
MWIGMVTSIFSEGFFRGNINSDAITFPLKCSEVIEPNDIVIANDGLSRIVGIGVIESSYIPPKSRNTPLHPNDDIWRRHARRVDWLIKEQVDFDGRMFTQATVHRLTPARCDQIRQAYELQNPSLRPTLERLFADIREPEDPVARARTRSLAKAERQLKDVGAFDPSGISDARERGLAAIVQRRGQPVFRKLLLTAYGRRCAITGCTVEEVLEAAHIVPYKGSQTDHPANGLLLRADVHTLFDLGLIAVDDSTLQVLVSSDLDGTDYSKLQGTRIRVPNKACYQPSRKALKAHRKKFQLE